MNEQIKKDLGENNTMMEGYTTEISKFYYDYMCRE